MIYDRPAMKAAAKARIKGFLPRAAVVSLLMVIFMFSDIFINLSSDSLTEYFSNPAEFPHTFPLPPASLVAAFVTGITPLLFNIFIGNIITVGVAGWFMRYSRGEYPPVGDVFHVFSHYKNVLKTTLLQCVKLSLWTLLLIIPGIIKGYAYRLVPYILNDNPDISPKEAIRISETMMDGWKAEAFLLDLSFFGWLLLSVCTCYIVGIAFAYPYIHTTYAHFYDTVKHYSLYTARSVQASLLNAPYYPPKDDNT